MATDVDEIVRPARQETEQDQPDQQQEMPVDMRRVPRSGAPGSLNATPHLGRSVRPRVTRRPFRCQPDAPRVIMVEEGIGWIGTHVVPRDAQLLPAKSCPTRKL